MEQIKQSRFKNQKGKLFIISAPSGAGKTTLCKALLKCFPDIYYSISYTTRLPRKNEKHGVDYFFISKQDFEKKLKQGQWAEWALVHGNFYGTSHEFLNYHLEKGQDVLMDIDVQGTRQILESYQDSITIFVMPPSVEVLRDRLESRGTDTPEVIERRLIDARNEMEQRHIYRHVIVNDRLDVAVNRIVNIVAQYRGMS